MKLPLYLLPVSHWILIQCSFSQEDSACLLGEVDNNLFAMVSTQRTYIFLIVPFGYARLRTNRLTYGFFSIEKSN
jgi:hypothetical protein